MTQIKQVGNITVLALNCKNTSGSDMAEGIAVMLDTFVSGQISVKLTSGNTVACLGITQEAIANGKIGRVIAIGVASATASGTITAGQFVMPDSAGKVLTQTATNAAVGIALQDALTTERLDVLLVPARNA